MKITTTRILKVCTLSMALLGSVAFVAAVSFPDVAIAKSGNEGGKGNGNGNGNGGGNGGGNGNGNGNGGGNGNSSKADTGKSSGGSKASGGESSGKTKEAKKARKATKADAMGKLLGVSASELGALNAAHASPNALKNASPNSRVGRIAAYKQSVLDGRALEAELELKEAELAGLDAPTRSTAEIESDLATAAGDVIELNTLVSQLEDDLAAAGGSDATIEGKLIQARLDLEAARIAEAGFAAERDDALAYEALSDEVDALTEKLEAQPELERSLLEAAANKPVTDQVEAAVKQLLGL